MSTENKLKVEPDRAGNTGLHRRTTTSSAVVETSTSAVTGKSADSDKSGIEGGIDRRIFECVADKADV